MHIAVGIDVGYSADRQSTASVILDRDTKRLAEGSELRVGNTSQVVEFVLAEINRLQPTSVTAVVDGPFASAAPTGEGSVHRAILRKRPICFYAAEGRGQAQIDARPHGRGSIVPGQHSNRGGCVGFGRPLQRPSYQAPQSPAASSRSSRHLQGRLPPSPTSTRGNAASTPTTLVEADRRRPCPRGRRSDASSGAL